MKIPAKLESTVREFLAHKRIAVAGVSRTDTNEAANLNYRKLRDLGYEVFAVNPQAANVEGDDCYPNLAAIPGGVEAVVIATHPEVTPEVVTQCADLGIGYVWMHRSFGEGSVADEAVTLCVQKGIRVIPGGCPMMFLSPVDIGHRCMRWFLNLTGKLPQAA
jgi:predicted CoA-binding protein